MADEVGENDFNSSDNNSQIKSDHHKDRYIFKAIKYLLF